VTIFVYEYLSCQPAGVLGESLRSEGRAMLSAVMQDFAAIPGVHVVTMPAEVSSEAEATIFRDLASQADFTLVIAPEFDELLTTRCQWVLDAGGRLLNPLPPLVELTADKLQLNRFLLHDANIPAVPGCTLDEFSGWKGERRSVSSPVHEEPASLRCAARQDNTVTPWPLVLKPRYGAGSLATFVVRDEGELQARLEEVRVGAFRGEMIVQPFYSGRAASVMGVIGPRQMLLFPAATQTISDDGYLRYLGGEIPLEKPLAELAERLARATARFLPGLSGVFGIDLLLEEGANIYDGWVVELNPRLTTSYVGLRTAAQFNVAEAMLAVMQGQPPPSLHWQSGSVVFGVS